MKPKVSVIMTVLNGERFIGEAIRSILGQTYKNCELVVVDDGSTDSTQWQVQSFQDQIEIRYIRHEVCQGIARSMNDGVRHATGDLISFLDHDDVWCPGFLETQTKYLEEHPDTGMVHSDFQTIDRDGNVIEESVRACRGRQRPSGNVFPQLFMDSFIVGISVLIRRECFTRLGMFDESLRWGDYHMWMRIARNYRVDYVDQVLAKYRQHPTQSTRTPAGGRPDDAPVALLAIKKILETYPEVRQELGRKTINRRISSFYFDLAYNCYNREESAHARVCLGRALRLWPMNAKYLKLYVAALLRPSQARAAQQWLRRLRGQESEQARGVRGITG
jgi:glycosyltransferase involved in cell wall biosynthesis